MSRSQQEYTSDEENSLYSQCSRDQEENMMDEDEDEDLNSYSSDSIVESLDSRDELISGNSES